MLKNKSLQYFVGKVCSIFTHPINRNFKEENPATFVEQPYHYFVGVIDSVEEEGILITQITTGLKSFFFMKGLIAIAEEEVLDPDNAEDARIINEIKTANVEVREKVNSVVTKTKDGFVDVDEMDYLLKNIKSDR